MTNRFNIASIFPKWRINIVCLIGFVKTILLAVTKTNATFYFCSSHFQKGFTPLHVAAKYGSLDVAKLLLQRRAAADSAGKVKVFSNARLFLAYNSVKLETWGIAVPRYFSQSSERNINVIDETMPNGHDAGVCPWPVHIPTDSEGV